MKTWIPAGKYGLRYREHENKTTGVGKYKRALRYYTQVYKWQGRTTTDSYGWEGEDFKNEDEIVTTVLELRQNRRTKEPPFTLREKIALQEEVLKKVQIEKQKQDTQKALLERTILDNVFKEYQEANTHKKSLKDEVNYYKNWIKPTLGKKRLDEIILLDLGRIKSKMVKKGKAARSIQYIKSIVRQIFNFAIDHKLYTGELPTANFLKNEKNDNRRQRYLSPSETELLLDKIREYSELTYQISLVSLHTGMRFGEIASLLWQHINKDTREFLVVDPKNSDTRSVFMTDRVLAMFQGMDEGKPSELVFPSQKGTKRNRISKSFAASVDDLKFNEGITDRRLKVVFHSLRHSCASILVNAGVEIPVIAKILGHKTLAMTMRYAHINDTNVQNAMKNLDQQQTEHQRTVVQVNSKQ